LKNFLKNRNFILILALIIGLLWGKGAKWLGVGPFQQADFCSGNRIDDFYDSLYFYGLNSREEDNSIAKWGRSSMIHLKKIFNMM